MIHTCWLLQRQILQVQPLLLFFFLSDFLLKANQVQDLFFFFLLPASIIKWDTSAAVDLDGSAMYIGLIPCLIAFATHDK